MGFLAQDLIPHAGTAEKRQNTRKILQKIKEATTQNNNDNRAINPRALPQKIDPMSLGGSWQPTKKQWKIIVFATKFDLPPVFELPAVTTLEITNNCTERRDWIMCFTSFPLCLQFDQLSHIDSIRLWSGFSSSSRSPNRSADPDVRKLHNGSDLALKSPPYADIESAG